MKEEEDNLDQRIERVVKSVATKRADMAQWESQRKQAEARRRAAAGRWRVYGLSAAASVALVGAIGIGLYVNRVGDVDSGVASSAPVFRGGGADALAEISAMIAAANYQEALSAVEAAMADTAVIDPSFTPERQEYLRGVNANQRYELLWLKIDLLAKTGRADEARQLLKAYVGEEGMHQQEAKELLATLEK